MKWAVAVLFLIGLLLGVDQAYLGYARTVSGIKAAEQSGAAARRLVRDAEGRQLAPEERSRLLKEIDGATPGRRWPDEWFGGSVCALAFLGCVLIWLVVLLAVRQAETPGSLVRAGLIGSVGTAVALGLLFSVVAGIVLLLAAPEEPKTHDRFEWEARWLMGAIGGAVAGVPLGLLACAVARWLRRPAAPASR